MASGQNSRLDSWKSIAAYLGRDVSTVIRWEKEKGLPVHRLRGGKRHAVFALKEEIDAWLTGQPVEFTEQRPGPVTPFNGARTTFEPPASTGRSWLRHWLTPWLVLISLLLIVAAVVFRNELASGLTTYSQKSGTSHAQQSRPGLFSFHLRVVPLPFAYTAVVADFNHDGIPDLAITGYNGNCVYVLLGRGDGSFTKPRSFPVGVHPDGIAVGDFDGDGRLDLAVANRGSNSVSELLGKGDGTFQSRTDLPVGEDPRGVAAGDFNGDGKTDLAVTLYAANSVVILTGSTEGLKVAQTIPVGVHPFQLQVGDFNHDGHLDLVVGNTVELEDNDSALPPFTLVTLLGNGLGGFRPVSNYALGAGTTGITSGDFNGDGKLDLAVTGFSEQACWTLLGNGDGTFRQPLKSSTGMAPLAIATGDFDGDGKLDLAVANAHSGTLSVFRGMGNGHFILGATLTAEGYPKSVVVADFNGDGKPDILSTDPLINSFIVFLNATVPLRTPRVRHGVSQR